MIFFCKFRIHFRMKVIDKSWFVQNVYTQISRTNSAFACLVNETQCVERPILLSNSEGETFYNNVSIICFPFSLIQDNLWHLIFHIINSLITLHFYGVYKCYYLERAPSMNESINQNTQRPCHDVGLLFFYYLQVNCRLYSGSSAYWCCCIAVFFFNTTYIKHCK